MNEQKLQVRTRSVEILLANGDCIRGQAFLQLYGEHLSGPQTIGEILNGEDTFFPVRVDGKVVLLNLEQIIFVAAGRDEEFDPLLELGREHRIRVESVSGPPLEAQIFVNLPGGASRVKDFLNQKKRFLLFLRDDQVVYLARNKIQRVQDEDDTR